MFGKLTRIHTTPNPKRSVSATFAAAAVTKPWEQIFYQQTIVKIKLRLRHVRCNWTRKWARQPQSQPIKRTIIITTSSSQKSASRPTWYTCCMRGSSGPVVPSFHPATKRQKQTEKNCKRAFQRTALRLTPEIDFGEVSSMMTASLMLPAFDEFVFEGPASSSITSAGLESGSYCKLARGAMSFPSAGWGDLDRMEGCTPAFSKSTTGSESLMRVVALVGEVWFVKRGGRISRSSFGDCEPVEFLSMYSGTGGEDTINTYAQFWRTRTYACTCDVVFELITLCYISRLWPLHRSRKKRYRPSCTQIKCGTISEKHIVSSSVLFIVTLMWEQICADKLVEDDQLPLLISRRDIRYPFQAQIPKKKWHNDWQLIQAERLLAIMSECQDNQ